MVRGIEIFKEAFKDYTDQFIIIGGTACDYIMDNVGLSFRATQDLDIVLIIEAINSGFFKEFWKFIRRGQYNNLQKSTGRKQFFRFYGPKNNTYPKMIELFSRELDSISLPEEITFTPIPIEEDISSLSAILIDDDYYQFIIANRIMINNLPFVTEKCLIPLKAKAWMDLSMRKNSGEKIDSRNIKKHKLDIMRLTQVLPVGLFISLPASIRNDMSKFIIEYEKSDLNPQSININMKPEVVLQRLRYFYQLDKIENSEK
ncbi:MAG: hypothetical protein K9J13_06170 [Saprospiraceae bacterium]|nr:hypothetical protein [Saprospiraceae bacterium]